MKSILIQAWAIVEKDGVYYLPYTHWIYLQEIVKYYDKVSLLSPIDHKSSPEVLGLLSLREFSNVNIIGLPYAPSYISSIKYFRAYWKALKSVKDVSVAYARFPVPFGWLQKLHLKNATRIIHFVGDPIDAAKTNPNFSRLKKFIMTNSFMPEYFMYLWACRGASVFTNGFHIAQKLKSHGIHAKSLISTTLNEADFYYDHDKDYSSESLKLLYVGYLRKAKGVETILRTFKMVQNKYPGASLTIVGMGEFEHNLKQMVKVDNIQKVTFLGHIDNREILNSVLRSHELFCFASLSEGSPRVILEAMANGLNVLSTPVGSLPFIFKDASDILFANYNDEQDFFLKIEWFIQNKEKALKLRESAFNKVKQFTIENFIKNIFHEA